MSLWETENRKQIENVTVVICRLGAAGQATAAHNGSAGTYPLIFIVHQYFF